MIFARADLVNVCRIRRCDCGPIGGTGGGFGGKGSGGGFGPGGFGLGGFGVLGMASLVVRSIFSHTGAGMCSGKRSGSSDYVGPLRVAGRIICNPAAPGLLFLSPVRPELAAGFPPELRDGFLATEQLWYRSSAPEHCNGQRNRRGLR